MSAPKARAREVAEPIVFVYGTLRRDARGPVQAALTRGWTFVGHGSVAAELYDLGTYPGAVPSGTPGTTVRGELYRVPDPCRALARLDRHEGCGPDHELPHEFTRALVDVTLESGGTEKAWIYWYRWDPRGRRLPSGDYLARARARSALHPPRSRS